MNLQREIVYGYRNEVLTTEDTRKLVDDIIRETIPARVQQILTGSDPYEPDFSGLLHWIQSTLPISMSGGELTNQNGDAISTMIVDKVRNAYESRTADLPTEILDQEERRMVLIAIDRQWQQHLADMDELREGVYLRAQGQKDPLVEYKNEAYELFVTLMDAIKQEALLNLFRAAASLEAFLAPLHGPQPAAGMLKLNLPEATGTGTAIAPGRNSPCTCGSGRKFKQCCGRLA